MNDLEVFTLKVKPRGELHHDLSPEAQVEELLNGGVEGVVTVGGSSLPCPVEITLGRDKHGRLTVTTLRIDAEKHGVTLNASLLRRVGVALTDLLRRIAEHKLEGGGWEHLLGPLLAGTAVPYEGVAVRPGRKGHSDEFYRQVAESYVEAQRDDPEHTYSLLARRLIRSESQTRRLVGNARQRFPELFENEGGAR